jgi:hypothetical protein
MLTSPQVSSPLAHSFVNLPIFPIVSSLACILYDIIITTDEEVRRPYTRFLIPSVTSTHPKGQTNLARTVDILEAPVLFPSLFLCLRSTVCHPLTHLSPVIENVLLVVRTLLALMLPPPPLSSPPFSPLRFTPHACKIWQTYQPIAALFLTIAIDIVLFLRGVFRP